MRKHFKTFTRNRKKRNLNDGKLRLKDSFEKEKTKGTYHQTFQNICLYQTEKTITDMIT